MQGKELKAALHRGDRVYATCITSTSAKWPPMVARLGLDFVFIDTEHIPIGRETLAWMCQTYRALDLAPIVRVTGPDPYQACVVLDGGASGVIFPYVESVEEVRALRGATKLRNLKGAQLQAILRGEMQPSAVMTDYLTRFNENNVMIVNIESIPALDALDQILAVPDVDALLIGPHDLSVNLGVPEQYDSREFKEAVSLVIRKAREKNVGAGLHYTWREDVLRDWTAQGANLIIHSSDINAVGVTLGAEFRQLREILGDVPGKAGQGKEEVI
jgi:2-keto-3-deoxy-L-rhamnonate aldolase RhmA